MRLRVQIEMAEPPVLVIRRKKQSSIVVGMNMVKKKKRLMHLFRQEAQVLYLSEDR